MWVPLLTAVAVTFFILFVIALMVVMRRAGRMQALLVQHQDDLREQQALTERLEKKCQQAVQTASQLDKAREEAKKAKKKTFDREKSGRELAQPAREAELNRMQEQAMDELRTKLGAAKQDAQEAKQALSEGSKKTEKLETELTQLKDQLASKKEASPKPQKIDKTREQKLDQENRTMKKQLETARRKSRTDRQVYMVTNSKLELAIEKVSALQNALDTIRAAQDKAAEPAHSQESTVN